MKKTLYMTITAVMMLGLGASAYAQQNLRSGYFLDGYTYKYRMNPSAQGERGFVAIPLLGSLGLGLESNVALSTFVFPGESGPVTFLHPDVSDDVFLDGIKDYSKMNANITTGLLAVGFRTGESYHTIDLSMRADVGTAIPKDMFRFMKVGASDGNTSYNLNNMAMRLDSRLELAYGYSRPITDWMTVGGRVKLLMGIAKVDMRMNSMSFDLNAQEWRVRAQGDFALAGPITISTDGESDGMTSEGQDESLDLSTISVDGANAKASLGLAFDLGVTADFLEYFTASASILDLGFMTWNHAVKASTPDEEWPFTGFTQSGEDEAIGDQLADMTQEMMDSFKFRQDASGFKATSSLAATVHVGLEARMPFYERLSFGILGTRRFEGAFSWTEGRIAAHVAPTNWLSATVNYAISDFGSSVGAALNLHTKGFTLFLGTDSILPFSSVNPQYIPINSWTTNLSLGLNVSFGQYEGRFSL